MKILLFVKDAAYGRKDLLEAFSKEGHDVASYPFNYIGGGHESHNETERRQFISSALHRDAPDVVFSFGYDGFISEICDKEKIRYISWTYDNPDIMLYSYTVNNPCNVIYVFDKSLYAQFRDAGISTVRYMPLAANTERLDRMSRTESLPTLYDISFVGSLYVERERGNYYDQMAVNLPDYANGYLDGLIAAQLKIQGYNFIEELLGPVINDLCEAFPLQPFGMETREFLYAQGIINRRITAIERLDLLADIAGKHRVDLFTHYKEFSMPNLYNHGEVYSYDEFPRVIKQSKINLNITLRSIHSGIPLRAFEIMGSGGFLLSNYQADFLDFFVPGEDFVYYEDKSDLLRKIDYYLIHEDERKEIAKNGHDKVAAAHTYRHRIREMLDFIK